MIKSSFVTRTAAGLTHANTLIIRTTKTVVVFLDTPHHPSVLQDHYQLIGEEAEYDRTLRRSEAVRHDEMRMALHFTGVPPVGTYSLYQGLTEGIEVGIFLDVPFADLLNFGEDASTTLMEEPKRIVFSDPPRIEFPDPLLRFDPSDFNLAPSRYLDLIAFRTREPE